MSQHEWAMTIEQAIEAEAQAQALCMLTQDFGRDGLLDGHRPLMLQHGLGDAVGKAGAGGQIGGPSFANGITKTMLQHEWAMTIEQAIEAEAQAQALCMLTQDFGRAYDAFVARQKPVFQGD